MITKKQNKTAGRVLVALGQAMLRAEITASNFNFQAEYDGFTQTRLFKFGGGEAFDPSYDVQISVEYQSDREAKRIAEHVMMDVPYGKGTADHIVDVNKMIPATADLDALLETLEAIANILHFGGSLNLSEAQSIVLARMLTIKHVTAGHANGVKKCAAEIAKAKSGAA